MRELVILRREEGSEVEAFNATGAKPKEIERAAWEDHRRATPNRLVSSPSAATTSECLRHRDRETG